MTSIIKVDNIHNSSGTSALSIDSSGRVSTPERPYIILTGNSSSRVTDRGTQEVYTNFDVTESKGITWNSSNGRITVPIDGFYLVTPTFYMWMNDAASHNVNLRVNGTLYQHFICEFANLRSGDPQIDQTAGGAVLLNLNANDYIDFDANADIYGGSTHTRCQVMFVG